ncbi:Carbohydrate sulfotransferase 15 [Holothuria leucospilota]|uniref:Carbohydrate sulfotransferase 15 n=1 Tax=Holothuria leucospilota TaxID=206669 RepID=A0A9Q1BN98_HOLLE|nr:Carbohydrate sulfotransferase 15 [Holothuria leucospilota]
MRVVPENASKETPPVLKKLPKKLVMLRPRILQDSLPNFSSKFKNPCYFDTKRKMHCLPYFFLLGAPKCGTTDIWSKMTSHPHIGCVVKEPHWWTRKSMDKGKDTLAYYESTFITQVISNLSGKGKGKRMKVITGDGSASTFCHNKMWTSFYPKHRKAGPEYIVADVIRTVLPNALLIVSLREPVTRLYSDYLFFHENERKSPEKFHKAAIAAIDGFHSCLNERSLRYCAYTPVDIKVRLHIGLYSVFAKDWLQRYPRNQIMFLRLEDWKAKCTEILPKIFAFLKVGKLSAVKKLLILRN